jgi:thiol-disulfide isomerase/thioredoxin
VKHLLAGTDATDNANEKQWRFPLGGHVALGCVVCDLPQGSHTMAEWRVEMRFLLGLLVAITGVARADEPASHRHSGAQMVPKPARPSPEGMIPSLSTATNWINSPPIASQELRGKVVLIDFWTYTCINWRRTVPYLRSWLERYGNSGLVLIGVHSPEFAFEHNLDNVRQAARAIGVEYPVAVDNDFAIWQAFGNQYWPALYVFDSRGRPRHQVFGEDGYEDAERVIRQLLEETGQRDLDSRPARVDARGAEVAADWKDLRSAENYVGSSRTLNFASPGGIVPGKPHRYAVPSAMTRNRWALSGTWTVEADRSIAGAAGGKIAYRFHARDLHLVMAPEARGNAIRFRVLLDGKPPGSSQGLDVDEEGYGTLQDQRMYQLIRQPAPIGDRLFEIEFLEPGASAFSFTFG